jgi:PilZ domain
MGVETFANNAAAAGQRSAKRSRVLLAAKLETSSGEIDARLRDLSRIGALVECASLTPATGSEVVFIRGKIRLEARVAWSAGNRIGLEFHQAVDAHELLVQLGKSAQVQPQTYRRPAMSASMNAQERKLAKAWSVAVGLNLPEK